MSVTFPFLVVYIHQCAPCPGRFFLSPPPTPVVPIGGCLDSERLSLRSPTGTPVVNPTHWVRWDSPLDFLSLISQYAPSLPVFIGLILYGTIRLNSSHNYHGRS